MQNRFKIPEDIYLLLQSQQAPERLIKHHQLVVEASHELISGLKQHFPTLACNYQLVLIWISNL